MAEEYINVLIRQASVSSLFGL